MTVRSQQVRALNLAYHLARANIAAPSKRACVIGCGAAGVTVAAALALTGTEVTALERKHDALHLQQGCQHRFLHPFILDWPAPNSLSKNARLPILNWSAGSAHSVAMALIAQWEDIRRRTRSPAPLYDVEHVAAAVTNRGVRVVTSLGAVHFDFAIFAVGFGVEKTFKSTPFQSYWQSDDFDEPDRQRHRRRRTFFVSGNSDGGLLDFMRTRVRNFQHNAFLSDAIATIGHTSKLVDIVQMHDRYREVQRRTGNLAAAGLWLAGELGKLRILELEHWLAGNLRSDTHTVLGGVGLAPFDARASFLNQLLAHRLMVLDSASSRYEPGLLVDVQGGKVTVEHRGERRQLAEDFDRVVIRHGPEPAMRDYPSYFDAVARQDRPSQGPELLANAAGYFAGRVARKNVVLRSAHDRRAVARLVDRLGPVFRDAPFSIEEASVLSERLRPLPGATDDWAMLNLRLTQATLASPPPITTTGASYRVVAPAPATNAPWVVDAKSRMYTWMKGRLGGVPLTRATRDHYYTTLLYGVETDAAEDAIEHIFYDKIRGADHSSLYQMGFYESEYHVLSQMLANPRLPAPLHPKVLNSFGHVLRARAEFSKAADAYREALDLAQQSRDRRSGAVARINLAETEASRLRFASALSLAKDAADLAEGHFDHWLTTYVNGSRGAMMLTQDPLSASGQSVATAALRGFESSTPPDYWRNLQNVITANVLCLLIEAHGRTVARRALERAKALIARPSSVLDLAMLEMALGYASLRIGKSADSLSHLSSAVFLAQQMGNKEHLSQAYWFRSLHWIAHEDWAFARSDCDEIVKACSRRGGPKTLAFDARVLSVVLDALEQRRFIDAATAHGMKRSASDYPRHHRLLDAIAGRADGRELQRMLGATLD